MRNHYKYIPSFLYKQEADYLYSKLLTDIPWRQVKYFKPERGLITTPRLTWVSGFHQKDFYSLSFPQKIMPNSIPEFLLPLKDLIEEAYNLRFNYILFSLYRDENDSIAYHSDDEKFLGSSPNVASLTLGQERIFSLKNKLTKEKQDFHLTHGDLFIMQGNCQSDYMHSVPKQKHKLNPRISLTFRNVLNESGSYNYYKYNYLNTVI